MVTLAMTMTDYDCEVVISVHKIQGAMKLKWKKLS